MRKFFIITTFFIIVPIFSMDQLTKDECSEVESHINEIEFYAQVHPSFLMLSGQTVQVTISNQLAMIEEIFDKKGIVHPKEKTLTWLKDIKEKVSSKKEV